MSLTTEERVEKIREAQEHIAEAIELIRDAVHGTDCQAHVKAYILDHLKIMGSRDHGFLSRDTNLDDVTEMIEDEDEVSE